MTKLERLKHRLADEDDWLAPWQAAIAPKQIDCGEALIRLILPARILRSISAELKRGLQLNRITTAAEIAHCLCPTGGHLSANEMKSEYWASQVVNALERTGYITAKNGSYAITAKGEVWLKLAARFSRPLPRGVSGSKFEWPWREWFPRP